MDSVLVLIRDLMFSSKVIATARATGQTIEMLRDPAMLANKAGQKLILDLNQPGTIEAAVAWKAAGEGRQAIGFVSHVDADLIARAKASGIDRVMPRSQFVQLLPDLLAGR